MHADDAAGARRDHAAHGFGIEVVGGRVDVGEDRRDALPVQCVGGGDEGPRGHDHFAFQSQRTDRDFQCDGAVAHRDAVLDAEVRCDALLELLHHRPVVGQPLVVEYLVDALQEGLAVADVGAADVQRLLKRRRCAVDGQVGSCCV